MHPLVVPGPSCQLPYASESFASIHAFSLPALLPAASLPFMLKECRRTLVSDVPIRVTTHPDVTPTQESPKQTSSKAGILHLTILDPTPLPSTLGPRLRDWLDRHLILHLERQFKCINPSRLFPVWLADANLRAPGSSILQVKFLACCPSSTTVSSPETDDAGQEVPLRGDSVEQQLESVIGRMLWKEMWGPYVQAAEKWWWEDESVMEECEKMRTCWEYAVIKAVKQE